MKKTSTEQPDNVSTEDAPQVPDTAVVTSDSEPQEAEPKKSDQTAASEPAGSNDQTSEADSKPKPTRNRSAERRIKRLSAKLSAAGKREQELLQRNHDLETQATALKDATPKNPEPKFEDFDNPKEYAQEYAKWEAKSIPEPKPPQQPAQQQPQATEPDPEISAFRDRGIEALGDEFAEAIEDADTPVNMTMGDYLVDSKYGPEIYVHLHNNIEDARKIFDSSSPKAIKALSELEAKAKKGELDAGDGELKIAPPPENKAAPGGTKAKEPPSDTKTTGTAALKPNPETEDMDDYANRRRKEIARAAGHIVN